MIAKGLLGVLRCPETHQGVQPAEQSLIERLNRQIAAGQMHNRCGHVVQELLEDALVRADHLYVYRVRRGLPVMLADEAIPLT